MSYNDIADMATDAQLLRRLTACAAQERITNPELYVQQSRWLIVSQPGWSQAWASARAANLLDPGRDEGVITDGMILSAVQALSTRAPVVR